eukprot:10058231-Ditylum_brightwellii.AAC.1
MRTCREQPQFGGVIWRSKAIDETWLDPPGGCLLLLKEFSVEGVFPPGNVGVYHQSIPEW